MVIQLLTDQCSKGHDLEQPKLPACSACQAFKLLKLAHVNYFTYVSLTAIFLKGFSCLDNGSGADY